MITLILAGLKEICKTAMFTQQIHIRISVSSHLYSQLHIRTLGYLAMFCIGIGDHMLMGPLSLRKHG